MLRLSGLFLSVTSSNDQIKYEINISKVIYQLKIIIINITWYQWKLLRRSKWFFRQDWSYYCVHSTWLYFSNFTGHKEQNMHNFKRVISAVKILLKVIEGLWQIFKWNWWTCSLGHGDILRCVLRAMELFAPFGEPFLFRYSVFNKMSSIICILILSLMLPFANLPTK